MYCNGSIFNETYFSPQEAPKNFQEAPRKLQKKSGQKYLQYFGCYFGRSDDTKKTFQN